MSLELTIKNMKVLPKLLSETEKVNNDSVSFNIGPVKSIQDTDSVSFTLSKVNSIVDSSVASNTEEDKILGGARKGKRCVRPKTARRKVRGGDDSAATNQLKDDIKNVAKSAFKTAATIVLDALYTPTEQKVDTESVNTESVSTINIDSASASSVEDKTEDRVDVSTVTESLINKLEDDTVQKLKDVDPKQFCGGVDAFDDDFDSYEEESEDSDYEVEQEGGANDFNSFINNLYNKKVGGRKHSKEAKENNAKTNEIIMSVYPEITLDELRGVKSEIFQTIRAKYEPEVFKTLTELEKSELLLKATTPEVVKKIDPAKAIENRQKRLEERFGKKDEETPGNKDEKKEEEKEEKKEEKEEKKEKKTKKAKKVRGGADDDETLELPFRLDGGCDCTRGGC